MSPELAQVLLKVADLLEKDVTPPAQSPSTVEKSAALHKRADELMAAAQQVEQPLPPSLAEKLAADVELSKWVSDALQKASTLGLPSLGSASQKSDTLDNRDAYAKFEQTILRGI